MIKKLAILTISAGLFTGVALNSFAEEKKEGGNPVKKVMKEKFKGDTSIIKKATKGELTKEEVAALLADVKSICACKPAKGDEASWKEKTGALVAALEKLEKGEAGAGEAVKTAANCKACHDVHKGK